MKHKIGDIVRFIFCPELTAMVVGYGKGSCFASVYNFGYDDDVILAMTEKGNVLVFKDGSSDWQVVDHVDMGNVFKHIVDAKEMVV